MLIVQNHRTGLEKLQRQFEGATILDVTSKGEEPWVRFSPFYPHGNIPVPFSPGWFSASVEGIWQGLKVFEHAGIDTTKFQIVTMRGLKRSARTLGQVLGHQRGAGEKLLTYAEARQVIYLPTYRWVLDHYMQQELEQLRDLALNGTVVLRDYETNCDLNDLRRPLSHAGLIKLYLEDRWPVQPFSGEK
ncbi:MAG: hypothetical protein J2P36_23425 [Ktedonobacteraceae bacterium]|nr:hypothetical protein [Ktedonobacteraceae bacterium]